MKYIKLNGIYFLICPNCEIICNRIVLTVSKSLENSNKLIVYYVEISECPQCKFTNELEQEKINVKITGKIKDFQEDLQKGILKSF